MEIGRALYNVLNSYFEIESPQVNLFSLSGIYKRLPYLRLRIKGFSKQEYDILARIIEDYDGVIKWKMNKGIDSKNYLVEPIGLDRIKNQAGQEVIRLFVDKFVDDLPNFIDYLNEQLPNEFSKRMR